MAKKKKATTASGRGRAGEVNVTRAIAQGQESAKRVLALRARQRSAGAAVIARTAERGVPAKREAEAKIPERTRRALRSRTPVGVLIAEGDSWFDYPMHDVLEMLEDRHGYDVESVAHRGDSFEAMAYSDGQYLAFTRRLEKLLRDGKVPAAILLSGGGNDIAGTELAILINHAASSLPPLNEDIVHGVIEIRLREAYVMMIAGLTAIAQQHLDHPIPIIIHGYDHPVPDGRGFLGGVWILPGPWLEPGFRKKAMATESRTPRA